MRKFFIKPLVYTLLLSFSSCGFMSDEDLPGRFVLDLEDIEQCELNGENFHKIFNEDISKDIKCLESSLDQFASFVRRDDRNYIDRIELEIFIKRFFADEAEEILKVLKPGFDFVSLLLREPEDKLSVTSITSVSKFLEIINTDGLAVSKILSDIFNGPEFIVGDYWRRREEFVQATQALSDSLIELISNRSDYEHEIDIIAFLEGIQDALDLSNDELNLELVNSLLFVKKLLLGGSKETITSTELQSLISDSSPLSKVVMDLAFLSQKEFESDVKQFELYLKVIREARDFVSQKRISSDSILFDQEDLLIVLNSFIPEFNWLKMETSFINFKERIIGGNSNSYNLDDFNALLDLIEDGVGLSYLNFATYDFFQEEMASPDPIEHLERPDLPEYKTFKEESITEMWHHFKNVAYNYRYFLNNDGFQYNGKEIVRDPFGFNILSVARWGLRKFFKVYSSGPNLKSSGADISTPSLNIEDVRLFIHHYQTLLEEVGVWPDDLDRFLNEISLGTDLFRNTSNGDGFIQIDEINEYLGVIIMTTKAGAIVYEELLERCHEIILPSKPSGVSVNCYRKNFFDIFFHHLGMDEYYNNMYRWTQTQSFMELYDYLAAVEVKGRVVNDSQLPVSQTDISRIITSLTNIETIFDRHDLDGDDFLTGTELENVFSLVEKTIATHADGLDVGSGLTRSAFYYLIIKEELPSTFQLMRFHVWPFKGDAIGTRIKVAKILSIF